MYLHHTTAMVLIPPQEIWEPIQAIRREHDRNIRRWMPHITLMYPFISNKSFHLIKDKLKDCCSQIEPFKIKLEKVDHFQQSRGRHILWVGANNNEKLKSLHKNLTQTLEKEVEFNKGFQYNPHLTIGRTNSKKINDAEKEDFFNLKSDVTKHWQPLEWEINEISLIWRNDPPDDVFRLAYSVNLGK